MEASIEIEVVITIVAVTEEIEVAEAAVAEDVTTDITCHLVKRKTNN